MTGVAIGVPAALAATRLLTTWLYEIGPYDPATFAVLTGTLALLSALASYLAARRIARIDPIGALRHE